MLMVSLSRARKRHMWLAISLGVVSFLTAVIGGYVTFYPPATEASKKRLLLSFVFLGFIAVVVTGVQAYKTDTEQKNQEKTQAELLQENQKLQKNLALIRFQNETASVEFRLDVPLEHPQLANYRSRLEKCVEQMERTQRLACGANHFSLSAYPAKIKQIWIGADTELFPKTDSELVAYSVFNYPALRFRFFNRKLPYPGGLHLIHPVLSFSLSQTLDSPENLKQRVTKLCYDFETKRVFLFGSQVLVKHDEWSTNDSISSISDLDDTFVVIEPSTSSAIIKVDETGSGARLIDESIISEEISETVTLSHVTLTFSNGKVIEMPSDKLTRKKHQSGKPYFVYFP
jgi:hypothetical protein